MTTDIVTIFQAIDSYLKIDITLWGIVTFNFMELCFSLLGIVIAVRIIGKFTR